MSFGDIYEANHSGETITLGIPVLDFILTRIYQVINIFIPFVLSYNFVKLARRENIKKGHCSNLSNIYPPVVDLYSNGRTRQDVLSFCPHNILHRAVLFEV